MVKDKLCVLFPFNSFLKVLPYVFSSTDVEFHFGSSLFSVSVSKSSVYGQLQVLIMCSSSCSRSLVLTVTDKEAEKAGSSFL